MSLIYHPDEVTMLLIGMFMLVFNRFVADDAVEIQIRVMGTHIDDPEKMKQLTRYGFLVGGVFFVVSTLFGLWSSASPTDPYKSGMSAEQAVLLGIGSLIMAGYMIARQKTATQLAALQARELLGINISEQTFHFILMLFSGVAFVCGATMIGVVISR